MSQAEMERDDLEVMGIVNEHAHPEASAAAEEIAAAVTEPVEDMPDLDTQYHEKCKLGEKMYRRQRCKEIMSVVFFVAVCLLMAAALVAAWYVPKLLIWVVNVGVLACGIAAAIKIDKYVRWWR